MGRDVTDENIQVSYIGFFMKVLQTHHIRIFLPHQRFDVMLTDSA